MPYDFFLQIDFKVILIAFRKIFTWNNQNKKNSSKVIRENVREKVNISFSRKIYDIDTIQAILLKILKDIFNARTSNVYKSAVRFLFSVWETSRQKRSWPGLFIRDTLYVVKSKHFSFYSAGRNLQTSC